MCFDAKTSMSTGLIGLALSAFLIIRNNPNDRYLGIFFLTVTPMQFLEYLMWKGENNPALNIFATKFAYILLWLQPVCMCVMAAIWANIRIPAYLLVIFSLIPLSSLLSAINFTFNQNPEDDEKWISKPGSQGHLNWAFFNIPNISDSFNWKYFGPGFIFLFLIPFWKGLIVYLTFYLSLKIVISQTETGGHFGSLWCWAVNFFLIIYILMNSRK